ncbi:MAG: hypothetical protein LBQ73_07880 [Tannerellaceae bacterium]|nr:hypothetical protein [Tannerellaceae bacterium]
MLDYNANVEIDALDQWLDKAQAYAEQGNYREAVLISKACIEEYAEWLKKVDSDIIEYINTDYQTIPFEILDNALTNSGIGARELFDYCRAEMMKPKYSGSDMFDEFNDLLMTLSVTVNPGGFIDLQNELLSKLQDKSSYKAKRILQRKIDFYTLANQPEKAWEVIEKNIQVEDYRKKVVEKKLRERQFAEAKKLILDFISSRGGRGTGYWHELLLHIAQNGKNSKSTVKRGVYDTI